MPFQGVIRLVPTSSQGVALGWILAAFQAEVEASGGNPGAIAVTYPSEFSQLLSTPPKAPAKPIALSNPYFKLLLNALRRWQSGQHILLSLGGAWRTP